MVMKAMQRSMVSRASDEETAFKLVHLYFEEVARQGFKRTLDLDSIINAYLYALGRLRNKDKELGEIMHLVSAEERQLSHESRAEVLPQVDAKPVIH
ncbi:MAG: hypothetical protein J4203_01220 [Candidatus Diapherotrites archaeon]|uniref:Uncharacterized protein n=2 Tax=Candidatus Iainarchaeum sp. TaxID=3101447 RepID=A0A8T4L598_9ARCH|nr:hypothetical protein [Candidatus Diapherotrites archaeon]